MDPAVPPWSLAALEPCSAALEPLRGAAQAANWMPPPTPPPSTTQACARHLVGQLRQPGLQPYVARLQPYVARLQPRVAKG